MLYYGIKCPSRPFLGGEISVLSFSDLASQHLCYLFSWFVIGQVYGGPELSRLTVPDVRKATANYMRDHPYDFLPFMDLNDGENEDGKQPTTQLPTPF